MKINAFKVGDKVTYPSWKANPKDYITILYKSVNFLVARSSLTGKESTFSYEDGELWELYVEPKAKVKKWMWATPNGLDTTSGFYREPYHDYTVKLEWSEQEFEG